MKKLWRYFSAFEKSLWACSVALITLSFCLGGDFYPLSLIASLVGVTALIFVAKGNVIGQFLCIAFSILYAIVSYTQSYYGEMITYLGMSLPSAAVACFYWLKNPSKSGRSEVQIAKMTAKKLAWLCVSALLVTVAFYFILRYFHTNNLLLSTLSVTTSYLASMLTVYRSPFYAVAYACNDLVLIGLWIYACFSSLAYLPMLLCFFAFLFNDLYGFYNWKRLQKKQRE
ncbi:MAG: nicotinamide mononucleotide transporter [Clostridia bacterium]|nr:nicotinamide mononucleotide transporter [Clostridia bacterium]